MAYVDLAGIKKVLKDNLFDYPADISNEIEFAESYINGRLAGHYPLRFDDVTKYPTVPLQIKWITAHLVGYKLWDSVVPLEGQDDDTAAGRWKKLADDWLSRLAEQDELLVLEDGTVIEITSGSALRFYPTGIREKASSEDNVPFFTRADAHKW